MSGTAEFVQGWYADPHGGGGLRWWDGTSWTDHVATEPESDSATEHHVEPAPETAAVTGAEPAAAVAESPVVTAPEPAAGGAGGSPEADLEQTGPVDRVAGADGASTGVGGSAADHRPLSVADPAPAMPASPSPSPSAAAPASTPVAEQTVVVMRKASPPAASGAGERRFDPSTSAQPAVSLPTTTAFPAPDARLSPAVQPFGTGSFPAQQYGTGSSPMQPSGDRSVAGPSFGQPGQGQPSAASPWGQPAAQPSSVPPYGGASAPAAWLQDPHGPGLRWWDGSAWTAHTAPAPYPAGGGNTVNVNGGSTTVVVGGGKSVGVAFLLTFFFGPIGLLYATVVGGLIMIGVELFLLILGLVTFGLAWLLFGFTWVICIVWGCIAAGKQPPVQVVHH